MYPSDFGYATGGGATTDRASCLSVPMSEWQDVPLPPGFEGTYQSYGECGIYNWLTKDYFQWTITATAEPYTVAGVDVGVLSLLAAYMSSDNSGMEINVRPSIYLKSNVIISGGIGSSSDPFILSVN